MEKKLDIQHLEDGEEVTYPEDMPEKEAEETLPEDEPSEY